MTALRDTENKRMGELQADEDARLRKIEEEDEQRRKEEEAARLAKLAEQEKAAREEEDRILREKQQIEDEKAKLQALKDAQTAEIAELKRKEEERKVQEARETEDRIERERIEREAMEKEKADLAAKQKEAEERLAHERDELERQKLLKEAEELEKQEQLRKEREAFEEERRRKEAEDEARRQLEEAKRIDNGTNPPTPDQEVPEPKAEAEPKADVIMEKKPEDEDEALEQEIVMSQELIQDFNKKHPVQVPPNAEDRTFNVNDILGDLDRDDRGNIIVLQDSQGNNLDKAGNPTNIRGYLTDPRTGDILENYSKSKMFDAHDMDEKGEVPAPFCLEKFNFNPHDLLGNLDFQYDQATGRAIP